MAKYLITIEGYDPTGGIGTPTNAELLQMVRESQCASDVGELVLSATAPDVVLYPILKRFRWVKTNLALVPTGEFYYHDGSSWVIEKPAVGSITGDMLVDGTVGIEKLSPDGDPLQIIRINAAGTAFEYVDIVDAIPDAGLSTDKLAAGSGADLALLSGLGGSWAPVSLQYFFGRIYSVVSGVTSFSSLADKIVFLRTSDNTVRTMTINYAFGSAIESATEITGTAVEDYVPLVDFSDGLFKKVLLSNLLPNIGVVAGTYTNPSSVTVNSKGQVTSISSSGSSTLLTAVGTAAIPAVGVPAVISHGITGVPSLVRVVLRALAVNNGYAIGDEVSIESAGWSASNTGLPGFAVCVDATNVTVIRNNDGTAANLFLYPKGGGGRFSLDTASASWQVKVYAKL
jgi:hypothetical protein